MTREHLSYAQKNVVKAAGLLMQRTAMISPGARIAVAVSGGVDSFTLLKVLLIRRRIVPFPFEIMAIHVNPGFDKTNHAPLVAWCAEHGVSLHVELSDMGVKAFSEENRKSSPCFYCAWFRRKRFFELCKHYGMTHLALGHNADDLVANFFMNIFQNGRVDGMKSVDDYFGGELRLIRPLMLSEKATIIRAAKRWELPIWKNPCPASQSSKRSEIFAKVEEFWQGQPGMRQKVYGGLSRWQLDLDS